MKPIIEDPDCGVDYFVRTCATFENSLEELNGVTVIGNKDAIEKFFSCFSVDTDIALAKAGFYQKNNS